MSGFKQLLEFESYQLATGRIIFLSVPDFLSCCLSEMLSGYFTLQEGDISDAQTLEIFVTRDERNQR